jgi:hypothetical protein
MKYLYTIVLCALLAFDGLAQDDEEKGGRPGLIGGWNYSSIGIKNSDQTADYTNGFYLGILWEERFAKVFRIQSGLKYVKNGWAYNSNDLGNRDKTILNYVSLPVTAKLKIGPIYALGGVYGSYRAGSKTTYTDGTSDKKISTDDIKRYDFGGQLGLGFQIAIIGVEARYNWGFTDISADNAIGYNNRYLELGLHLHLR